MNYYIKLLINSILSIGVFFLLLLIPTAIEYLGLLSLNLSIYSYLALLLASTFLTLLNLKIIKKRGLLVGFLSSVFITIFVLTFVVTNSNYPLIDFISWPIPCTILFSSIFGSLYVNCI